MLHHTCRVDAGNAADIPTRTCTPGHSEYVTPAPTPQHTPGTQQPATARPSGNSTSRQHAPSASQHPVSGYVVSTCLTGDVLDAGPGVQDKRKVMVSSSAHDTAAERSTADSKAKACGESAGKAVHVGSGTTPAVTKATAHQGSATKVWLRHSASS